MASLLMSRTMYKTKRIISLVALIWFGGVLYGLDTLAATIPAGTLIKTADNPAVYYIGGNGRRYKFPDSGTYHSWYYDFRFVRTVPAETMSAIPDAGPRVTVHPGSALVKFADDEKIYAVANGALLRAIT